MYRSSILLLSILLLIVSCDSNVVDTQSHEFSNQSWGLSDVQEFTMRPPDTLNKYDLFINMRNNQDYGYSNLWLITQIKFPLGKVLTDTLEYPMADPQGNFLGTSRGSGVVENKLWLKKGVRFAEPGDYILELRHSMRKNGQPDGVALLEGILDIGYSIESPDNAESAGENSEF